MNADILIVGTGHGGAQTAAALRQRGFQGSITMIGEEAELPYERPPLSKEYLVGARSFERMLIRPESFWSERRITVLTGRRVVNVDAERKIATTSSGETLAYRKLVWAAGGHARRLSCAGHDLAGVHSVRTRADVDRLLAELPGTDQIAIIGGGYIGLEAAAALIGFGKRVTILEAQDRILARVAGEPLARFYEAEHRARGVDVRLSANVQALFGTEGRVSGVRLHDNEVIPCQVAIVGIGIVPSVAPLTAAGAEGDNGVLVDAFCRTGLPDIYAIGDCALHKNRYADSQLVRVESVQNANDMATTVAKSIVGIPEAYDAVPWFWSNQYDLRLQTVGISSGFDQVIIRGDPRDRAFSLVYCRDGAIIALDCVNNTRDYVQGRALVLAGAKVAPDALARIDTPLKDLTTSGATQPGGA